jgi:hypothetical protein
MYTLRRASIPTLAVTAALSAAGLALASASPAASVATRDQLAASPLPTPGPVAFASDRPSLGIPTPAADGSDARIWVSASPLSSPPAAPVQLTLEPRGTQDRNPDFSPDGTQVAFASGQPLPANGDPQSVTAAIKIIDVGTRAVRTLADAQAGQDFPAFSPDGARIAFVAGGALWVKATGAAAGTPAQLLAADVEGKPSWSADGSTIYFTRGAAHGREVWRIGPLGGATPPAEERVVTSSNAPNSQGIDNFDPAVSPDGSALCYSRTVPGRLVPELARFDLATGAIAAILSDSDDGTVGGDPATAQERCAWSPDGRDAIFTATDGFPATRQGATSNLRLASVAGDALANPFLNGLNDPAHFDGSADWAPAPPGDGGGNGGGGTGTGTGTGGGSGTGTGTGTGTTPPPPPPALKLSALRVAPLTWALGSELPKLLTARAKGPAASAGRLVRGRCVAATHRNRRARACTRLAVGTVISFRVNVAAKVTIGFERVLPRRRFAKALKLAPIKVRSGLTRLRFEGRLSRTRRLVAGARYRIVLDAEAPGSGIALTGPTFTIVKRSFTVSRR